MNRKHMKVSGWVVRMGAAIWLTRAAGLALPAEPFVLIPRASGEKYEYHLFNPTPVEQMRELSTDRPDQTESPFTVDAGHFQVEVGLVDTVQDRDQSDGQNERTQVWGFSGFNLKLGLLNNVDLQFVLEGFVDSRVKDQKANVTDAESGLGALEIRLKINVWGNDEEPTAFALMPFVKWPMEETVGSDGDTEGGIILPLGVALPAEWRLGLMTEFDFVRDGGGGYDTEYFHTIALGHDIVGALAGYLEFAARFTPERNAQWQGQLGGGLTYALDDNTQLDLGGNFGVTRAAPDLNAFVGMAYRF